jgi:hypothetical protein
MRANRISEADRVKLEQHFRAGRSFTWAASLTGVNHETARRYFRRFALTGIQRGPLQRKPQRRPDVPVFYDGPDWIGERVVSAR